MPEGPSRNLPAKAASRASSGGRGYWQCPSHGFSINEMTFFSYFRNNEEIEPIDIFTCVHRLLLWNQGRPDLKLPSAYGKPGGFQRWSGGAWGPDVTRRWPPSICGLSGPSTSSGDAEPDRGSLTAPGALNAHVRDVGDGHVTHPCERLLDGRPRRRMSEEIIPRTWSPGSSIASMPRSSHSS